jgi:hypothetical protein
VGRWFCHTLALVGQFGTLVGQVGPVGVMAQLAGLPGDQLDTAVSDAVFTAAVQKVRRAT